MKAKANGIEIEYESYGKETDPAILLIMGFGAQLVLWPMPFVEALVAKNYRVIRYDNRDIGLSTKIEAGGRPRPYSVLFRKLLRLPTGAPYALSDMAADAAGLLDALGIARAHVVGASMGGMIAQLVAANYPARTLTLTSIMSTTGNPRLPRASKEAMQVLVRRPQTDDVATLVAHGVRTAQVIGSPAYPVDEAVLATRAREMIERSYYPDGLVRQMAAIIADGDRRTRLAKITAPTLVIHGAADPLVPVEGGRDTAAHIPGAQLLEIPGMGHNLPVELIEPIAEAIDGLAKRAG